jgi:hypothetical protein
MIQHPLDRFANIVFGIEGVWHTNWCGHCNP